MLHPTQELEPPANPARFMLNATVRRKPPLTWDAKKALEDASKGFFKIALAFEHLKEPSLKSFIAEAISWAELNIEYAPLYRAIAEMAEWKLEVRKRYRTGRGVWYAVLSVMEKRDTYTEEVTRFHQRCEKRADAVKAAKDLVSKHVELLSASTWLDVEVMTDLEWERLSGPGNP